MVGLVGKKSWGGGDHEGKVQKLGDICVGMCCGNVFIGFILVAGLCIQTRLGCIWLN